MLNLLELSMVQTAHHCISAISSPPLSGSEEVLDQGAHWVITWQGCILIQTALTFMGALISLM